MAAGDVLYTCRGLGCVLDNAFDPAEGVIDYLKSVDNSSNRRTVADANHGPGHCRRCRPRT